MTGQITDPMLDRVAVTQINVARLLGSPDVLVRFTFSAPPPAPAAGAPVQATASLQLTPELARELILLLASGLNFLGTGIPDAPMPKLN